ncbi:uncharacterized protein LOC124808680 [Hydra vulgaris]|uniref:uncharacterized protein LOC124808680 n=1 Tax=Hydra vulgaris TaxID=6087 RepID=UPI001F5EBDD7|nr:uncharacterized protein LOC124808680 [Hydra vulgaris]
MPKVSYMGIPGGFDSQQKTIVQEVLFDEVSGKIGTDTEVESFSEISLPIIINKEVFDEPCTIHASQLDNTESSKLVYVKRKTPLRKSLDLSTTSSAPFSHLFNVPLSNAVPTVTQHISTSTAATETISMLENQNIKIKKPRMSNNTKLSSLNVDNYMSDMAKIGAKIVTAGEKIATALNPTVKKTPLLESIG